MKINTSRKAGFTLVEIMIVVAIIGLLAAIAIPNFVKARNSSQKNACINNLRQLDAATQQWAMENNKSDTSVPVNADVYAFLKGGLPKCPGSGIYALAGTVADTNGPTCTITDHKL
jgi:prepilin-type N-terminal cleavage/methylation domain-containing protein